MGAAECTDGVEDLVHFGELHAVHGVVQVCEGLLDGGVFQGMCAAVGFVEEGEDGISVDTIDRAGLGQGIALECIQSLSNFLASSLRLIFRIRNSTSMPHRTHVNIAPQNVEL